MDANVDATYPTIPIAKPAVSAVHPRVAVILGVNARWHIPLQICRALSTAPATWWGLRYALIFLGELLFRDGGSFDNGAWSIEKRFRVTEVFLAILWVKPWKEVP